jgi:hypothetical protein
MATEPKETTPKACPSEAVMPSGGEGRFHLGKCILPPGHKGNHRDDRGNGWTDPDKTVLKLKE